MGEKHIEQKLVKAVKAAGGMAPKFISPGLAGMPDRLMLLPKGKVAFVEVKSPGMKPRPLQIKRHRMLRHLGFKVYVLDDATEIKKVIAEVMLDEVHTT
ncbi:MAG: VRR-NUC domain-containing protein [Syntrophomonadaceae bacterium]